MFLVIALATCHSKGGGGDGAPLSSDKAITAFSFANPAATGTIDENAKTISVTIPLGTNLAALVVMFTTTGTNVKVGSMVQVSGTTSNDFTNPVAYIVTAADGTTTTYTVTINGGVRSSYTTTFPLTENPISEGDNWINAGTLTRVNGNFRTTTNLAYGLEDPTILYGDALAILTGTWPSDQTVQATVSRTNTSNSCYQEVELGLRRVITPTI